MEESDWEVDDSNAISMAAFIDEISLKPMKNCRCQIFCNCKRECVILLTLNTTVIMLNKTVTAIIYRRGLLSKIK